MGYTEFIQNKLKHQIESGFDVDRQGLNKNLFEFQRHVVHTALKCGKYAIFADCGLGKTIMQLSWAHEVALHEFGPVLILCPLAVSGQTISEGNKFGIEIKRYDGNPTGPTIYISNYEQLDNIDTSSFVGVVLDESSILKNFTGATKRLIIEKFRGTKYKLACSATPSPNDHNELGNHSEFLNILPAPDMRARWFVRDEGMNNYRLKAHAEKDFFAWVSTWAVMFQRPSDIGFEDDERYNLPPVNYIEKMIKTATKDNGLLFNLTSVNATEFNKELRLTIEPRFEAVADIVNKSDEPFIIWVNQNAEEEKALALIPDAVAVRGNMKPELKEARLLGFAKGEFRVLVTKKKIAQFGLNYQHCNNQIFASLDFSFEGLYQAIRRSHRFGQEKQVNIWLITTDTMENVLSTIKQKQEKDKVLRSNMNKAMNGIKQGYELGYNFEEVKNDKFWIMRGDCVKEIDRIEDGSIDFSVFSPPFSTLFTYSDNIADMGNNESDAAFFEQYMYLLKKLYRKMRPGRIVAVHTKDLARYKNSSGYTGLYDFTGDNHRAMEMAGFKYHSKITIWTDPVLEMQRTKTQRLLYKQLRKDSSYTGVGLPEYVTLFRKWEGDEKEWKPINNKTHANFPLDTWQKWASPIWSTEKEDIEELERISDLFKTQSWFDIRRTDVLNNFKDGTDNKDEKHIAPLQLSVIRRCVQMWSNPGEVVFTPFAGIGSELYESIKLGRYPIGTELKKSYFDVNVNNCRRAVESLRQATLF